MGVFFFVTAFFVVFLGVTFFMVVLVGAFFFVVDLLVVVFLLAAFFVTIFFGAFFFTAGVFFVVFLEVTFFVIATFFVLRSEVESGDIAGLNAVVSSSSKNKLSTLIIHPPVKDRTIHITHRSIVSRLAIVQLPSADRTKRTRGRFLFWVAAVAGGTAVALWGCR